MICRDSDRASKKNMTATPFQIEIPDAVLADLRERLERTRWPTEIADSGWNYGTNRAYLQELCAYWADGFDWRRQEAALNRHDHYMREVDGFRLHYIHAAGQGPDPLPLVLTHGWPSTFYELDKVIEPLGRSRCPRRRSRGRLRCLRAIAAGVWLLGDPDPARLRTGAHR